MPNINRCYLINGAFLVFLFMAASCQNSQETKEKVVANYKLEIVDSVQVDLLTPGLSIVDVNSKTGDLLAIKSSPPTAYVLSVEGEILKKMDRPGDDPQAVGASLLSGEFYEDGFALMGRMIVKTYDADFNLRKSLRATYPQQGFIYMGSNHIFELEQPGQNLLLTYFGPQTETPSMKAEYYDEYNFFDILNPDILGKTSRTLTEEQQKEIYQPIGKLSDDSRYRKGKAFYFMRPMFDVKNNQVTYAQKDDTTLFKMDLPSGELVKRSKIPFDKFILFQGYSLGQAGIAEQNQRRDRAGRIVSLKQAGEFQLIVYHSGMKLTEMMALDTEAPDIREQIQRIDFQKHLILKDGKRVNSDLPFPKKVGYIMTTDDDGFIWGSQSINELEEEPELITFYKLKIVAVE